MLLKKLLIIAFLFPSVIVCGQDSLYQYSRQNSAKKAVSKLKKSLETSKSTDEIATDYMVLANELSYKQEYVKAENYLQQAITSYQKGKDKEALANAYRELARVQELQSKSEPAIENYNRAAQTSRKKAFKEMNLNDANRLKNRSNPEIQSTYIQKNIDISNLSNNQKEAANAYRQMAEVKLEMKDKEGAIDNLVSALDNVPDQPEEAVKIKQDIAQAYLEDEQYEKAIAMNEALVEETKKISNPVLEVKQLRNLSSNYLEVNNSEKAISALKEAYELAVHSGQTMEAKKTLEELVSQYQRSKENGKALLAYANFIAQLDTLIKSDSTLIDQKFFQAHEEKIAQLEKERTLKDELITKKNRFNYVLLGSIVLMLIFTFFIARALYAISHKNKKIALQSLRREMNPHFIFNSLNSVNQFIAQSNELEANKYLSSYSRLMRNMMENSNKDFISLSTEIEQMKEYLELEHMRFRDKFSYRIIIDESLDADTVCIPNMIIQPQLENAIWHGLRYKEEAGLLVLDIQPKGKNLFIRIEDNGIGLKKSKELKTQHQKQHHSRGLINTYERIELLNKLYHTNISLNIEEKEAPESGVVVTLEFPSSSYKSFNL